MVWLVRNRVLATSKKNPGFLGLHEALATAVNEPPIFLFITSNSQKHHGCLVHWICPCSMG